MAKTLDQLPALAQPLQGTDLILVKTVVDSVPLDFKVSLDVFLQDYVKQSEVGTEIGELFRLIDDGNGNAGLPAISGALLTNVGVVDATGTLKGSVYLSDSISSNNGVSSGFAATSKSVADLNALVVRKAGDVLSGSLTFANDTGITLTTSGGQTFTGLKTTASDDLEIGQVGTSANSVKVLANTSFKVCDTAGDDVFVFGVDGSVTGITAGNIPFTPYTYVTATTAQAAIQQVADAALTSGGGTFDGPIAFANNVGVSTRNSSNTVNYSTIFMDNNDNIVIGQQDNSGSNYPNDVVVKKSGKVSFTNQAGVELFAFNNNGSSSGIRGQDVSFASTGTISAATVSAAINELDNEKQNSSGSVIRSNNTSFAGRLLDNTIIDLVKINPADEVQIGESGAPSIVARTTGDFVIKNSGGSELFKVTQAGVVSGITSTSLSYTPYGTTSATNVAAALNELADDKLDKAGGYVSGDVILSNAVALQALKSNATPVDLLKLTGSDLSMGTTTSRLSAVDIFIDDSFNIKNSTGATVFSVQWDGTIGGISAGGISFNPSGNLSSNTVQQALVELDTEKLGTSATATNSLSLGGVSSSSFAREDTTNSFTSRQTFNAGTRHPDNDVAGFGSSDDTTLAYNPSTKVFGVSLKSDAQTLLVQDNATTRFTFEKSTGNFIATGNITAYSDKRLKRDIKPIRNALSKVNRLHGCTFERVDIETSRQTGLIAQELKKVLPEAVQTDENGNLSIAYGQTVGLLVEAIKELKREVDELKKPKRKFEWLYKLLGK